MSCEANSTDMSLRCKCLPRQNPSDR